MAKFCAIVDNFLVCFCLIFIHFRGKIGCAKKNHEKCAEFRTIFLQFPPKSGRDCDRFACSVRAPNVLLQTPRHLLVPDTFLAHPV
ncbi:hypothetical protein L596_013002 [Steinernema carpocapsae]|uniref:Uncharacterized protein n=1 Tax=Steinernema carpocapsae TaxID=34508 RepID=A0A4U5NYX7_STECR|nr:hypothetical protein L596_013002 [Steinernema carpocapsae]